MTDTPTTLRFYGRLGDILGPELQVQAHGCSIAELRQLIARQQPAAETELLRPRVRACVADSIVGEEHVGAPGSTVEFFPPVSGG